MKSVELIDNRDGTWAVIVFGIEVYRGSKEGAELRVAQESGDDWT